MTKEHKEACEARYWLARKIVCEPSLHVRRRMLAKAKQEHGVQWARDLSAEVERQWKRT